MKYKQYQLFCGNCGYKRFTDGSDIQDLVQVKKSTIQKNIPQYNPEEKKTIIIDNHSQCKRFKCPKCGHLIKAIGLKNEQ